MLCFNLETRAAILAEPAFEGASMAVLGGELRGRWSALSFEEQHGWEMTAAANKEAHALAMVEYKHAMDVYGGKASAVAAEAGGQTGGGPKVDPEFLRRCGHTFRGD